MTNVPIEFILHRDRFELPVAGKYRKTGATPPPTKAMEAKARRKAKKARKAARVSRRRNRR